MKRSTFRKSSLISSVALLLVAIVALSGATFAWFTTGTSTTASGIELKAESVSGLYIVEDTSDTLPESGWEGSITFANAKFTGNPVSADFTDKVTPAFATTTTTKDTGVYDASAEVVAATAGKDYIAKHVWVKGDGKTATSLLLTLNPSGDDKGYSRIAIVDITDKTKPALVGGNVLSTQTENTAITPLLVGGSNGTAYTPATTQTTAYTAKTNWVPEDGAHLVIYCWFEGQDAQCKPSFSGATLGLSLQFDLPQA